MPEQLGVRFSVVQRRLARSRRDRPWPMSAYVSRVTRGALRPDPYSQFQRCLAFRYAYAIVDIVSRKWIATILAAEATGTQVRILFLKALDAEGMLTDELAER